MLHTQTVAGSTLELLKTLMRDEWLSSFYLVGGTNLALHLGHRTSIDLDLFSEISFNSADLETYLKTKYRFQTKLLLENTVQGYINDIKVDLLSYPYPLIDEPLTEQDIRMYGFVTQYFC
ncbi:MAG: nucleotidyl transferase AbiEii/AbiGii toxin family protein [Dysgonamonadaceae bacterium]|jgi:hypothetical protein|nr:nucleotidyl transferase AbiEii/AbiGii toxin family protein [Dysgonamonadaceae bacterium]